MFGYQCRTDCRSRTPRYSILPDPYPFSFQVLIRGAGHIGAATFEVGLFLIRRGHRNSPKQVSGRVANPVTYGRIRAIKPSLSQRTRRNRLVLTNQVFLSLAVSLV